MKERIFAVIRRCVLWALFSGFLWVWIFTMVKDPAAEKKLVIYSNAELTVNSTLAVELDALMPDGIRFVQVRSFTYGMFDSSTIESADILILKESDFESFEGKLYSGEKLRSLFPDNAVIQQNGSAVGLLLETSAIPSFEWEPDTAYYLCFTNTGIHAAALTGNGDCAAITAAEYLLQQQ